MCPADERTVGRVGLRRRRSISDVRDGRTSGVWVLQTTPEHAGIWPIAITQANSVTVYFGFDGTPLGRATYGANNALDKATMVTHPEFVPSITLQDLVASGDLFRGDPSTEGTPVDGTFDVTSKSILYKGATWKAWGSSGYQSTDTQYQNHANVIQVTWGVSPYPGSWWVFMKSMIANDPNNN